MKLWLQVKKKQVLDTVYTAYTLSYTFLSSHRHEGFQLGIWGVAVLGPLRQPLRDTAELLQEHQRGVLSQGGADRSRGGKQGVFCTQELQHTAYPDWPLPHIGVNWCNPSPRTCQTFLRRSPF